MSFLTLPLVIFILALISAEAKGLDWHFHETVRDFKFLNSFFNTVTALVMGLSGLHSFDKYQERKQNGPTGHAK